MSFSKEKKKKINMSESLFFLEEDIGESRSKVYGIIIHSLV